MEVRDPIHGPIHILKEEIPIIEDAFFQRLRNIKQLGFSEYVFPGATHTRFLHSLGVMRIAMKTFERLFHGELQKSEVIKLQETLKLACLLHDIGHAPLSHATESAMPLLKDLQIAPQFLTSKDLVQNRQASHEDFTIKSITDSSLSKSFGKVEKAFGVHRDHVAELIVGHTANPDYFTINKVNYFPLLHQLVTSEMDCDRMDYLLRDSYFCGVSYGRYDLDWIIDNLRICQIDGHAFLGISERAVSTFDDFLLSRFHMFLMVYFHYRAVCLEQLLLRYFQTSPNEYQIPAQIEDYQKHDDHYLMDVLRNSKNKYAMQIVKNSIPNKIFESFGTNDEEILNELEDFFKKISVEFIRCSSKSRLSKYIHKDQEREKYPIKVVREFSRGKKTFINIDEATDLFSKYSEAHTVTRLYCNLSEVSTAQKELIFDIINRKLK